MNRRIGYASLVVYGAAVFLANWLIHNVGPVVVPGGSHLIPVGFGLLAPTGSLAAGVTFVARDVVQRTLGRRLSLLVILPGIALTALMDPRLALASATAFALSETLDYLVYTPLQQRHFVVAVVASGVAASILDSLVFLSIAGIPLAVALAGLLLAKLEVMVVAAPVAALLRSVVGVVPQRGSTARAV